MVAYSFKSRFGPLIRLGQKTQTVRADRKRHARPGETLQLYTGMRTRSCQLLATAVCLKVSTIRFEFAPRPAVEIDGRWELDGDDLGRFAQADGFADWDDLAAFWAKEHPGLDAFEGVLIQWTAESLVLG